MTWKVDLKRCYAKLGGDIFVHFYPLPNGGFSVGGYNRTDNKLDRKRDWPLIEDAIASIAEAVAKAGPNWNQGDAAQQPIVGKAEKRQSLPNS